MPTNKKRVNLTLNDEIYEKLQAYKEKNAIESDATACLQLVTIQLRAQETNEQMLRMMKNLTVEQIQSISSEGLSYIKDQLDNKK